MVNSDLVSTLKNLAFINCSGISDGCMHVLYLFAQLRFYSLIIGTLLIVNNCKFVLRLLRLSFTAVTSNVTRILGESCMSLQKLDLRNNARIGADVVLHLLPDKLPELRLLKLENSKGTHFGEFLELRPDVHIEPFRSQALSHIVSGDRQTVAGVQIDKARWRQQLSSLRHLRIDTGRSDWRLDLDQTTQWLTNHGSNIRKIELRNRADWGPGPSAPYSTCHEAILSLRELESLTLQTASIAWDRPFAKPNSWPHLVKLELILEQSPPGLLKEIAELRQLRHLVLLIGDMHNSSAQSASVGYLVNKLINLLKFKMRLERGWLAPINVRHGQLRKFQLIRLEDATHSVELGEIETFECVKLRKFEADTTLRDGVVETLARARFLSKLTIYPQQPQLVNLIARTPVLNRVVIVNHTIGDDVVFPPTLWRATLRGCTVSDAQLLALCTSPTRLDKLELTGCSGDVERGVQQSASLRALVLKQAVGLDGHWTLTGAPNLDFAALLDCNFSHLSVAGLVRLTGINIIGCDKMTALVLEGLPNLRHLRIQECRSLVEARVESLGLETCRIETNDQLCRIDIECPSLGVLHLSDLNQLQLKDLLAKLLMGSPLLAELYIWDLSKARKKECVDFIAWSKKLRKLVFRPKGSRSAVTFERRNGQIRQIEDERRGACCTC